MQGQCFSSLSSHSSHHLHQPMAECTCLHTLADPAAAVRPCAATVFSKRLRSAVALRAQPLLSVCRPAISGRANKGVCSSGAAAQHSTRRPCRNAGPAVLTRHAAHALGAWCMSALAGLEPAAAAVHAEPANALSLPTWAIHVSSTVEWGVAMYLVWRYAEVTGGRPAVASMQPSIPMQAVQLCLWLALLYVWLGVSQRVGHQCASAELLTFAQNCSHACLWHFASVVLSCRRPWRRPWLFCDTVGQCWCCKGVPLSHLSATS